MRLSSDNTGWHARGVIARDARHVHNGPEVPRTVRGKKDRTRWCGGHEGREHKPECRPYKHAGRHARIAGMYVGWLDLVCTVCGKELDFYHPWDLERLYRPVPDWAKDYTA